MTGRTYEASITDFIRAIGLLVRRVRAAAAESELSISESMVLGRLEREGPATTAELARCEGVKPQSMGTTVTALEEAGFVTRSPHPTDGRQMMVSITARGTKVRLSARAAKETWLAQVIAQLDRQDQETLFAAGEIIHRLVENMSVEKIAVKK